MPHPSKQNIKVAVDNCIFTVIGNKLHVLLIQMKKPPLTGKWALPGGLIRETETLDAAAQRILQEETGVKAGAYLEQLYTFGEPKRDPLGRVISTAYLALVPAEHVELRTTSKYAGVEWRDFAKLQQLAYDHDAIVRYAKKRLAWKLAYTNVAWSLLAKEFILSELRQVYEAILGKKLDRRNFQKKILASKLLVPAGEKVTRGPYRPAALYRFASRKSQII